MQYLRRSHRLDFVKVEKVPIFKNLFKEVPHILGYNKLQSQLEKYIS